MSKQAINALAAVAFAPLMFLPDAAVADEASTILSTNYMAACVGSLASQHVKRTKFAGLNSITCMYDTDTRNNVRRQELYFEVDPFSVWIYPRRSGESAALLISRSEQMDGQEGNHTDKVQGYFRSVDDPNVFYVDTTDGSGKWALSKCIGAINCNNGTVVSADDLSDADSHTRLDIHMAAKNALQYMATYKDLSDTGDLTPANTLVAPKNLLRYLLQQNL